MALTSSLYSGVSGLVNMGNAMQVIGDNIANVNTNGFKGARATFQDIMAQSINTARGGSQVGRGSAMSDVAPLFSQGSFESTSSPTDLAIAGNGFFMVTDPARENSIYYTRAGQFHVDKTGYLVNPAGLRAQGWEMETQPDGTAEMIGSITDIQISNNSAPVATDLATVTVNLDSRVTGPVSPTRMVEDWDGTQDNGALAQNVDYEYSTTFNVYDSLGNTHEITVRFDRTDPTVTGNEREWEFLVTMDPQDDRGITPRDSNSGLLMAGYVSFTPQGQIDKIYGPADLTSTPIDWSPDKDTYPARFNSNPPGSAAGTAAAWERVSFGDHNYPQLVAFFLPPTDPANPDPITGQDASAQLMELNFGAAAAFAAGGGIDHWNVEAISTTQYANRSSTLFYDQNGFGAGFLETLNVDSEGVISGSYSNGRIISLARIALARFNSPTDLSKEGGSLWRQTTASGAPITGPPRTNGLGSIAANALEQSTVDMGTEFVKLITTQRAFQANSRVITTTDDMLQELMAMKR